MKRQGALWDGDKGVSGTFIREAGTRPLGKENRGHKENKLLSLEKGIV